jgi:hypothetical protein
MLSSLSELSVDDYWNSKIKEKINKLNIFYLNSKEKKI